MVLEHFRGSRIITKGLLEDREIVHFWSTYRLPIVFQSMHKSYFIYSQRRLHFSTLSVFKQLEVTIFVTLRRDVTHGHCGNGLNFKMFKCVVISGTHNT